MKKLLHLRLLPLLFGMLLSMPVVFGQNQITVKGTIIDEDGQPVIGAAILQKGTTNGVQLILTVTSHYWHLRVQPWRSHQLDMLPRK